jgi:membrane protein DedA with SNARE-associated domain
MNLGPQTPAQVIYLFNLIHTYGYYIIFPLIVVEGPGTTFVSGFFMSLGYLDPLITYFVIVSADLFGDIIYYVSGRWWIHSVSNKVLTFFKISPKHFTKFKETYIKHKGKIMLFGKFSSFIGGLVMYIAGLVEVPFVEFIVINGFGAIVKTFLLLVAGYYFGSTLMHLNKSLDLITTLILLSISVLVLGFYLGITFFSNKYIKRVEG